MNFSYIKTFSLFCWFGCFFSLQANETRLNDHVLGTFLQEHCISCHGPNKQKASLRLDELDFVINDKNEALDYQDVLDVLNSGEMPPEDEPQPSFSEIESAIGELTQGLFKARKVLASNGGKVEMRRLNRREYAGTIRHLFGMEPIAKDIPQDRDVENFDTVGARQSFTTEHFDLYYELGQKVLKAGFKWAGIKKPLEVILQDPEHLTNSRIQRFLDENGDKTHGKVVRLSKMRREYLKLPDYKTGVYLDEPIRHLFYSHQIDPRAKYKVSLKAGLHGNVHKSRRFVNIHGNDDVLAVFRVDGSPQAPTYSETEVVPRQLEERFAGRVGEDRTGAWLSHYINALGRHEGIDKQGNQGLIWIDHFKFEGPFYPEKRSFFDRLLCPDEPTPESQSSIVWNDDNAKELITKFTYEAFRQREPNSDFIEGLSTFFSKLRGEGKNFNDAMIDTLAIVLASPGFLYHHEKDEVKFGKRKLNQTNVASRLSYFLTGGPPDPTLHDLAKKNKLSNMNVYHKEVDRLLDRPESTRFIEGFISQWADFDRLDSIKVSGEFPGYTGGLRHSMKHEVIAYFDILVRDNMPVSNMIQSDFAVVNAKLANHYGIPGVTRNDFVKVMLPEDSPRGGFISQGAFHVSGSTGMRTSPTVRGMLLLTRFFNSPPPPPPPNVPELGSDVDGPLTSRQLVELHQKQAQCSSCHRKMDTLGLALENFDSIGRWRLDETVGREQESIAINGELERGAPFNNYREFQFTMLAQEENLARNMVESLIVYGLGRDIEFTDRPHVDKIIKRVKRDGYRMKDMIHAVASSPIFFKN